MMSHPPRAFYNLYFSPFIRALLVVVLVFFLVFPVGCHRSSDRYRQGESFRPKLKKLAVVGFKGALLGKENPRVFRCPICGATFMAEPVPENVAQELTSDLFDYLENVAPYSLIPPEQAQDLYSTLFSQDIGWHGKDMLKETKRSVAADAILFGYVYRWRERVGTRYGVESPASVAFDLHLIRPEDGSLLWKGSFDKTQLSLTENVLDLSTFIRSGGKWLLAQELARIGLEKLIKQFCPVQ